MVTLVLTHICIYKLYVQQVLINGLSSILTHICIYKLYVQQVLTNGHSSTHIHLYLQTVCTTGTD